MINFNLESEKMQNELIGTEALIEQLKSDKQTEIQIETGEINERYVSKENEANLKVNEIKNSLQKYQDDIILYSTFNHELIGNALIYLIKIFDGLNFDYEYGIHRVLHKGFFKFDENKTYTRSDKIKMLIKKEMKNPSKVYEDPELGENIIDSYVTKKEAIVLKKLVFGESFLKNNGAVINFYRIVNNRLVLNVNFNGFTYLEDFINYVTQYRCNNNLKEFSNEDIKKLIVSFVNMHRDEINARHFERLNSQVKSLTL